jgi:hypothetical protein
MAKRSVTECAAVLDICRELQIVEPSPLVEGRDILFKIVSMLIKLIRSFEVGQAEKGAGTGRGTGTRRFAARHGGGRR